MNELTKGVLLGFILGVVVSGIIVFFLRRSRPRSPNGGPARAADRDEFARLLGSGGVAGAAATTRPDVGEAARLRQNLRVKFLHDEEKVNAALAFERERNPDAGDIDWLRAAIYRWERDNR